MIFVVFPPSREKWPSNKSRKEKSFTLLELIIVIVIVGILAVLGLTQYTRTTEKMRQSEGIAALGSMRKLAHEYYLKNSTLATVTLADLGVGTGLLPSGCSQSTHYFYYSFQSATADHVCVYALRCTSSGKSPSWSGDAYVLEYEVYPTSRITEYSHSYDYATTNWCTGYCVPPF